MIQDGRRFPGPIELINHHKQTLDGFLTKPRIPCARPEGVAPMAWPGVTMLDLEQAVLERAISKGLQGQQLEKALGPLQQKFISMVAKELHKEQPWFHGGIEREGADMAMLESGHQDGKFLVREKGNGSFALSISYRGTTKHYRIDRRKATSTGERLAIEDGPQFENLMDMIAHYHNKTDGLLCKLTVPCEHKGYRKKVRAVSSTDFASNSAVSISSASSSHQLSDHRSSRSVSVPAPSSSFEGGRPALPVRSQWGSRPSSLTGISRDVLDRVLDEPDLPDIVKPLMTAISNPREMEKIYDSVPRTEDVFNLNRQDLELVDELGAGNFGSVMRGVYKHKGMPIPVAVKTLKKDDMPTAESELLKEARVMAALDHGHIVRMIGVCRSDSIMLVLELAPLGPLNKYLKKNPLSMPNIIELLYQVAVGMAYLESKNFVHRDLAARNVLLVDEHYAKISDFGMSKALGIGNEYYKAETAGKWPLKWYAPECIYYFKFDSKSDIWSYGVTLWEATSYGAKPYRGMRGCQIIELIDHGDRLEKPPKCPPGVYEIMRSCWARDSEDRPTFQEIVDRLKFFL